MSNLLSNVHEAVCLQQNLEKQNKTHLVAGKYDYYHYLCDGVDDKLYQLHNKVDQLPSYVCRVVYPMLKSGWGCGYRTLQTICSWMTNNCPAGSPVPTIKQIQSILVEMEDKPRSFLGSRQWIGSVEVCLVIDKLYDVPCKIVHVTKGELTTIIGELVKHFDKFGSPVMMGGDMDCSSKGVMGIDIGGIEPSLLIVDPHYVGKEESKEFLQHKGWVKWQPLSDFLSSSFYNLCLPQVKSLCKATT